MQSSSSDRIREAKYRQALALEPGDSWTRYFTLRNLGFCLNLLWRFEEGERPCHIATRVAPAAGSTRDQPRGAGSHPDAFDAWVGHAGKPTDYRAHQRLQGLLDGNPELLERPGALAELERCRSAVTTAQELYGPR